MLRKILMASVATATIAGSAMAADLPLRAPPPPYIPPPILTWQGFYVGVNGGALWTNSRDFVTTGTDLGSTAFPNWSSSAALAATNVVRINNRAQGLVGGTWGYNWQFGSFVLGTESDFEGVFGCRNNNNGSFFGNDNNTCGGTAIGIATVGGGAPTRLYRPTPAGLPPQPRLAQH